MGKILSFFLTIYHWFVVQYTKNGMLGGYVHDTAMSQFISPMCAHITANTNWTEAAADIAGTICRHKAAAAETCIINIPILIPSNAVALKGSYLKSVEIDYEIEVAACTSVTATMNKVTRVADLSPSTVAAQAVTQDLAAAVAAATVAEHRLTVTVTTPFWIDHEAYVFLVLTVVAAATTTFDLLGAVANYTLRE
jgi:hypothetical protein